MGLRPDGDAPDRDTSNDDPNRDGAVDFTLREAVREPSFWWVAAGHTSALFIVSAMSVHLVSFLHDGQGYSLGKAAAILFVMTIVQFFGTHLSGGQPSPARG